MKRRSFLRRGVAWTGLLWVPSVFGQQTTLASRSSTFRAQAGAVTSKAPNEITGLVGWWKADAIVGKSDGDAVTSWPDSASVIDSIEAGNAPTYKTGIKNSLPVVRFDGVNDVLYRISGHPTYAVPFTIVGVFKCFVVSGVGPIIAKWNGALQIYPANTWNVYNTSGDISVGTANTNWHVMGLILNGASSRYRIDGGAWTTFSGNPGTASSAATYLGANDSSGGSASQVDWAEFIRYDNGIAESDGDLLFTHLNSKWAVY